AFTQGYMAFWDAQQGLQEASKRFVQVDAEQQSRIVTLQTLLPALVEEAQAVHAKSPAMVDQPPIKNQSPLPHPASGAPLQEAQRYLATPAGVETSDTLPALHITCFGGFAVKRYGLPV